MTLKQFQQLSSLYHAALELEPHQREPFLREACAQDDELLREVRQLLVANDEAGSFLMDPATGAAAKLVIEEKEAAMIGRRLGHYRILSRIGAGGMGEVYLAEDQKLGRKIALKLLPTEFATHPDRLHRFEREAKAASATDHPNIVTIHEIGESEGIHYIATEFVEGETLRARIKRGQVPVVEALDIVIQTANALAASHSVGIVHRDIKPENIMQRPDGFIKVLDFGLAGVTQNSRLLPMDSQAPTVPAETAPGSILGTVAYMSPEQTRGEKADARSDLWSLGVVLYEMLVQRAPFRGASAPEVFVAILHHEPSPLSQLLTNPPPDLERMLAKLLVKDREQRYQSANDLLSDLKKLKRRLEYEAESLNTDTPRMFSGEGEKNTGSHLLAETAILPPARESQTNSAQPALPVAPRTLRSRFRKLALVAIAATVFISLALGAYWYSISPAAIDSIAVMPLTTRGVEPEFEYLTDGIIESLINNLSRLPRLKVTSRASVFHYKGKDADPVEVVQKFKVKALLVGQVIKRGTNLVINLELIDAHDNSRIWSKEYNSPLSGMLLLQNNISQEIFSNLRLRLTNEERARVSSGNTKNSEAYEMYLQGNYHFNKLTLDGFNKSVEYFNQAIAKDENYALAYAALSISYYALGANESSPLEMMPKAEEAAQKAIALDDNLAEGHVSLATVKYGYRWDWSAAESEFQRALKLKPNSSGALSGYGYLLEALGRVEEAIPLTKKALELDPLSLITNLNLSRAYYYARHYDQSLAALQKALELEPAFFPTQLALAQVYSQKGMYKEALAVINDARQLHKEDPNFLATSAYVYATAGRKDEARTILNQLEKSPNQQQMSHEVSLFIAAAYTALEQPDQAFAWLEKLYQAHSPWVLGVSTDSMFDRLRSDSRYKALLRRNNQSN